MPLVVGIPSCAKTFEERLVYSTNPRIADALLNAVGALPIAIQPMGEVQIGVLDRIDGLLVPGSATNVHPSHYGCPESLTPDRHDPARDATTLPLIRAAVARGMPVLAICRGIQELNVAYGGTLHQKVQEVSGRLDHRWGEEERTMDYWFRLQHTIALSGQLARIVGATEIKVNSLHQQAIDRPADALVVEAVAPDGTIEAVRVKDAPGFAFGVQWHPEWNCEVDANSTAIFRAFGDACRAYAAGLCKAA